MANAALKTNYVALPVGTYEEGLAMIGYRSEPVKADIPLDLGVALALTATLEDPNPVYWDAAVSEAAWGARIVPSAVLKSYFCPLPWYPGAKTVCGSIAAEILPLPGDTNINVEAEETLYRPLKVGDWLSVTEEIISISEKKKTSLGDGYFVKTRLEWRDEAGELVGEGTNTLLRYTAID